MKRHVTHRSESQSVNGCDVRVGADVIHSYLSEHRGQTLNQRSLPHQPGLRLLRLQRQGKWALLRPTRRGNHVSLYLDFVLGRVRWVQAQKSSLRVLGLEKRLCRFDQETGLTILAICYFIEQ